MRVKVDSVRQPVGVPVTELEEGKLYHIHKKGGELLISVVYTRPRYSNDRILALSNLGATMLPHSDVVEGALFVQVVSGYTVSLSQE